MQGKAKEKLPYQAKTVMSIYKNWGIVAKR